MKQHKTDLTGKRIIHVEVKDVSRPAYKVRVKVSESTKPRSVTCYARVLKDHHKRR